MIGGEATHRDYARWIIAERSTLPASILRDAMVELFPSFIGVQDVLDILQATGGADNHGGLGFQWEGPRLVEKLDTPSGLENLLFGVVDQMGGGLREYGHHPRSEREQAYFPAIAAAVLRLLRVSPPDSAPEIAIDAILRICNGRYHVTDLREEVDSALSELHRTSSRRRTAFWRVVENLRRASLGWSIDRQWQLDHLGYPCALRVEDVGWLLADGLTRGEHDCRLAVDAALSIYRSAGSPAELLKKIASAVSSDAVASAFFIEQTELRQAPIELAATEREHRQIVHQNAVERAKRDQSWIDFVRDLQADPQRIAKLRVPPGTGINSDLSKLWHLLDLASGRSGYSIDSVAPLERIVGSEIAQAVRTGLIAHWRSWTPLRGSRNTIRWFDAMGLAGLSMEAVDVKGWAGMLSSSQATQAADYAMLEINRFPRWLSAVANSRPAEVGSVLVREIVHEITLTELTHYKALQLAAYAGDEIAVLLAPALLDELDARPQFPPGPLPLVLQILARGLRRGNKPRFTQIGVERFQNETEIAFAVPYLAGVFHIDPRAASKALSVRLSTLADDDQTALVDHFLANCFGDFAPRAVSRPDEVPADILEELVRLTFKIQAHIAGHTRPTGGVHQTDVNHYADSAINTVWNHFVKTPGAATYRALLRFQDDPLCPIPAPRLRALARDLAVQDAERAPWLPSEALAFEQHHETAPRTPRDLQSVVLRRLKDMQHDFLYGDFSQGRTLQALPHETDVQNLVAERLRLKQGRSYSIEREPHVVGEKEPDVRARARATDTAVAVEIKVAETWSLKKLDDALEVQLCGRYLQAPDGRYGILLLVHKHGRPNGWLDKTTGNYLSFTQVVARLSARAAVIAGTNHDSPQPEVAVLDVSGC